MKLSSTTAIAALCLASTSLFAHHGRDFLLAQDFHTPAKGDFHLFANFEWENGDDDEYGLSPALMLGVMPQVAASLETSFRQEPGDDWRYSSITPMLHIQLSDPDSDFPVRFGLAAGYTFADEKSDHKEHTDHGDDEEGAGHAEHAEHHHEDVASEHDHGGIHQHGVDAFVARFIAQADLSEKTKLVGNLITLVEDGGEANWGYAAAIRTKVTGSLALGVEALGDFETDGWHEVVGSVYLEPVEGVTFKLGAGFGLTEATPDFILHTGMVWHF